MLPHKNTLLDQRMIPFRILSRIPLTELVPYDIMMNIGGQMLFADEQVSNSMCGNLASCTEVPETTRKLNQIGAIFK